MKCEFYNIVVVANGEVERKAADLLSAEIEMRTEEKPRRLCKGVTNNCIELCIEERSDSDNYRIIHRGTYIKIIAHRLRGLIYGYSYFLRKSVLTDNVIILNKNISCVRKASMKIRGHQLSYTDMNNTYESWDEAKFRRYFLDLMMFSVNMIEGTAAVKDEKKNRLMKYDIDEAMNIESTICQELDLDFSVWHPLTTKLTDDETIENVREIYKNTPQMNVLFPPGGDPGDLECEDFITRCIKMKEELKKKYPQITLWPSAQAPHEYKNWGETFKAEMKKMPKQIDGIIYGPNHAMPLDEMRRSIDLKYPIRFYPDVAHNVRCEVPVHFNKDDWHYSLAATLSREAINPRPTEYRLLHRITRQYVCGSVTYSEGVNDDLNKIIWSEMDFDFDCKLRESIMDYCRAFIWNTDPQKMTDAIFSIEQNWNGDPAENSSVNNSYNILISLKGENPELLNNWRFVLFLFRSCCDKLVRDRRIFELELIDEARTMLTMGNVNEAERILSAHFSAEYNKLREDINKYAKVLFDLIGIQLDVEHFSGMSWERGCTLDTIDNPVTDRRYLLKKLTENRDAGYILDLINRNVVDTDEYYFSFAEHGFDVCGKQAGEYYINFCGDSNFNAEIPMCITKVYDHFSFSTKVAGLTGGDYKLRITYKSRLNKNIKHHKVCINGYVVYDGVQFGGIRDEEYEKKYLPNGFVSVVYDINKQWLQNGCATLEITEPIDGFMISEFTFKKA